MEFGASLSVHIPAIYRSEEKYNGIVRPKESSFETSYTNKTQFSFIVIHKLIKTLNQEVRDKLRHPQWKHFKHMEIGDSDRARISNIIWRSWHIKFQHCTEDSSRISPFLDFAIPDIDTTHKQTESVVLEGQYWCRKNVRVALEYANWRQEFMRRVKKSQILSKQSSHSDSGTKIVGKEEATGSLFRNTHNDPDFPIFTQNEIDELVMLDMHDTLFTSNPPHNFSSQISDLEYFPSNYTIPTPFELQNIQPALDHLHPYYQGYYEPLQQDDSYRSNNSLTDLIPSNSIFSSNLPNSTAPYDVSQPVDSVNTFRSNNQTQPVSQGRSLPFNSLTPQILMQKFSTMENPDTYNSLEWSKTFQSQSTQISSAISTDSYINNHGHLFMTSPLKQLPSNDILDYGNSKTSAKDDSNIALTPHVSNIDSDLGLTIKCLQQRMQLLEEQVAIQQNILKPFLEHTQLILSSPKSNTTTDSASPAPSAKRFCSYTDSTSPRNSNLSLPWGLPDSSSLSCVPQPYCTSPSQPKYSSDYKRRSGIKSMLEQLEAKLPKSSIDGARLSNATLLIRAAEYAKTLNTKVKNLQNQISDYQSSLSAYRDKKDNLSCNSLKSVARRKSMSLENTKAMFESYIKERSKNDPKFFIFSILMRPFFEQFNSMYFPSSKKMFYENLEEFCANYFTPSRMRAELSNNLPQLCKQTQFSKYPKLIQSDILSLIDKK